MKDKKESKKRRLSGIVVSTSMKDTIIVSVGRYFKHPKYGKFVKSQKRYKAHNTDDGISLGDKVVIEETKPISKDKSFIVVKK